MSVQFFARAIYMTTSPAVAVDHYGERYVNEEFPVGSIYCEDMDNNLYRYVGLNAETAANCWPNRTKQGIRLYRDFWRHISSSRNAPYTAALLNADKKIIKAVK
jgi:hypothetical protein